jgi:hypothetical protein
VKSLSLLIAVALVAYGHGAYAAGPKPAKPDKDKAADSLPSFDLVTKQVKLVLSADPDYQEGDLITAPKVERILTKLDQVHWKVADGREIVRLALPEGDWMAAKFSLPDGRQFMRRVASMAGGYDRVDRLRHLPNGDNLVSQFIEEPDGFKMIEYMTSTRGGQNLGDYLSEDPDGANFNRPTGRIYTEQQLLKRLRASYDVEDARRHGVEAKQPEIIGVSSSKGKKSKPTSKSSTKRKPVRRPAPEPAIEEEQMLPPADSGDGPPQS